MTATDLAAQLYAALKNKPCACSGRWTQDGFVIAVKCGGCVAIAAYEAFTAVAAVTP